MLGFGNQADIDGPPRFDGSGRKFERSVVSGRTTKTKDEFLHGQVAGVCRQIQDVAPERDDQWSIHGGVDPLEDIEIQVRDPTFHAALDHSPDAGTPGQVGTRPPAALAHGPDLATDPDPLVRVPSGRLDRKLGASHTGHDRHMFIPRPSSRLI